MKSTLLIAIASALLTVASCSNLSDQKSTNDKISTKNHTIIDTASIINNSKSDSVFFNATGTEPFWGLKISERKIVLDLVGDSIVLATPKLIKTHDPAIKTYLVSNDTLNLDILIIPAECENGMSGKVFPYTTKIKYKRKTDKSERNLSGCGDYVMVNK